VSPPRPPFPLPRVNIACGARPSASRRCPRSPCENGYAESFHSRVRDELLNAEEFADAPEAKAPAAAWRHECNHHRHHSSLGYAPPALYAATLAGGEKQGEKQKDEGGRPSPPPWR